MGNATLPMIAITNKMQVIRNRKWVNVQRVVFRFDIDAVSLHLANGEIVTLPRKRMLCVRGQPSEAQATYCSSRTAVVSEDGGFYR